jgi:hypothetical protein
MTTNIADRIFASSAAGPLNGFAARTLKKEQVGLTGRPERWADQSGRGASSVQSGPHAVVHWQSGGQYGLTVAWTM